MEEYKSLNMLYPNLGNELENRHSAHYSNLRRRFSKIYEDYQPQYYISVKSVCRLFQVVGTPIAASMAIENGMVIAFSPTFANGDVYVNTPEQDQEIYMNCKGELKAGSSVLANSISQAYQMGLSPYSQKNLFGAIIYCDFNVAPNANGYWQAVRMGFAIVSLVVNGFRQKQKLSELQSRLLVAPLHNYPYSMYQNMGILCGDHSSIPMNKQLKMQNNTILLCSLHLRQNQIEHIAHCQNQLHIELEALQYISRYIPETTNLMESQQSSSYPYLMHLIKQGSVSTLYKYLKEGQYTMLEYLHSIGLKHEVDNPQKMNLTRRLRLIELQYQGLYEVAVTPDCQHVIKALNMNCQAMMGIGMLPQRIMEIIKMCKDYEALAVGLVQGDKLAIVCDRKKMLGLFDRLKKDLFVCEEKNYQEKTPLSSIVKKMMFSTLPSRGCGLLNPSEELWFM